jgi:hypothetical protein
LTPLFHGPVLVLASLHGLGHSPSSSFIFFFVLGGGRDSICGQFGRGWSNVDRGQELEVEVDDRQQVDDD